MQIRGKGITFQNVCDIVNKVSAESYDGHVIVHRNAHPLGGRNPDYGFTGRITADKSRVPGARMSWSGRATNAACWHVFRDVIRAVLTQYPDAVVTTGMARYDGLAGFERDYPATGSQNIGSMMQPAYMPEMCDC